MKHRKISTLMTTDVAVVRLDTPFKQITRLLEQRGISGVPVVDTDYRVLGVVSAADLLPKESQYEPPGVLARLARSRRRGWSKARATVAADLMTTPAVTVGLDAHVVQAAKLMDQHKVTRLPVVDGDGKLALVYGLIEAPCRGWADPLVLVALAVAEIGLLAAGALSRSTYKEVSSAPQLSTWDTNPESGKCAGTGPAGGPSAPPSPVDSRGLRGVGGGTVRNVEVGRGEGGQGPGGEVGDAVLGSVSGERADIAGSTDGR